MSAPKFTPGPWRPDPDLRAGMSWNWHIYAEEESRVCFMSNGPNSEANARLIAAAPDHVLICWAMCVQDATWEEWGADGRGEFCYAGLRHATRLDDFGAPALTPALRSALQAGFDDWRVRSAELAA